MQRYEHGKIYKIVDVGLNKCYYGSTTEPLSKRMERHRRCYKQYLESGKVDTNSRILFSEYGIENCKIFLVEDFPCDTKEQLLRREGEYIRNNACVNKQVAGRTHKEYHDEFNDYLKVKQRERIQRNKAQIRAQSKEYRETEKEHIKERGKLYYQQNKESILEKQSKPFYCDCGATCVWGRKARHFRTKKHQEYMKQLQDRQEDI